MRNHFTLTPERNHHFALEDQPQGIALYELREGEPYALVGWLKSDSDAREKALEYLGWYDT